MNCIVIQTETRLILHKIGPRVEAAWCKLKDYFGGDGEITAYRFELDALDYHTAAEWVAEHFEEVKAKAEILKGNDQELFWWLFMQGLELPTTVEPDEVY